MVEVPMDGRRPVVLVVDDNAQNRALAQATLEDEGYAVVLAASGEAGVAAFLRDKPDCVLLDVRMPGMDGIAAAQRIREAPGGNDIPIVFVTAQRDVETFDRARLAGGDDFITKPFRPTELVLRVATAMKLHRIAAERNELFDLIRRQRDDVMRLQLQREQLIAFLVHDLKNPVHAIKLHSEIISRDRNTSDRSRAAAASIVSDTEALLRMIMNLLDLSKADEGALKLRLPRDGAAHHSGCYALHARRELGEAAGLGHRRTATESARRRGKVGCVRRLHVLSRDEGLQADEILTSLESEKIQQPARRRHEPILQITVRKVTPRTVAVKASVPL